MKLFISILFTLFIVQSCYADWPVKKKAHDIHSRLQLLSFKELL